MLLNKVLYLRNVSLMSARLSCGISDWSGGMLLRGNGLYLRTVSLNSAFIRFVTSGVGAVLLLRMNLHSNVDLFIMGHFVRHCLAGGRGRRTHEPIASLQPLNPGVIRIGVTGISTSFEPSAAASATTAFARGFESGALGAHA